MFSLEVLSSSKVEFISSEGRGGGRVEEMGRGRDREGESEGNGEE